MNFPKLTVKPHAEWVRHGKPGSKGAEGKGQTAGRWDKAQGSTGSEGSTIRAAQGAERDLPQLTRGAPGISQTGFRPPEYEYIRSCAALTDEATADWPWVRKRSSFRGLAPMGDKGQEPVSWEKPLWLAGQRREHAQWLRSKISSVSQSH